MAWSVLDRLGGRLLGAIAFLLLTRLLEPPAFGLVAMAKAFHFVLQVAVESGLGEALIQRRGLQRAHLNTAFWLNLALGLGLAALALGVAEPLAQVYREPELAPIVRWMAAGFVFTALGSVPGAILYRRLAFRPLAARALAAEIAGGSVIAQRRRLPGMIRSQLRDLRPPRWATLRILADPRPGAWDRVQLIAIACMLRLVRVAERVRVYCGGEPLR
jgi:O-antigen/teichoic acid export membrane protein